MGVVGGGGERRRRYNYIRFSVRGFASRLCAWLSPRGAGGLQSFVSYSVARRSSALHAQATHAAHQYPRRGRAERTRPSRRRRPPTIFRRRCHRTRTIAWSTTRSLLSCARRAAKREPVDDHCDANPQPSWWRHTTAAVGSATGTSDRGRPAPSLGPQSDARHPRRQHHRLRQHQLQRPSPLVCRRHLMPRPVFPVVRLPYDQPDRVARVLDAVRRELRASPPQRQSAATATAAGNDKVPVGCDWEPVSPPSAATMTARVQQQQHAAREPEVLTDAGTAAVEQVTVGVRDCTLTPKTRPEIMVTANLQDGGDKQRPAQSATAGGPYLLVPPVNITAEISRPPLTPFQLQYHHTTTS